jgi:hypothetical protein
MKMLHMLINDKQPARKRLVLPTSLVVRKSCGCNVLPASQAAGGGIGAPEAGGSLE